MHLPANINYFGLAVAVLQVFACGYAFWQRDWKDGLFWGALAVANFIVVIK